MKRYYPSLDVIKFIFALLVMVYHGVYVVDLSEVKIFPIGGYIAVDLFFMISGFLMVCSATSAESRQGGVGHIGQDVFSFMYGKIKSIYPYFLFAFTVSFVATNILNKTSALQWINNLLKSIWELLLLSQSGLSSTAYVGGNWYISAMLMAILVIYPLLRRNPETYLMTIAPICTILYLGYFSVKYGYIHVTGGWNGIIFDSVFRAIGGLNIGCLIYAALERLQSIRLTVIGQIFLLSMACFGYAFVLITVCLKATGPLDFIWILVLSISLILTLGTVHTHHNAHLSPIFSFIRIYSLALYLNHIRCARIIKQLIPEADAMVRLSIYFVSALLLAIICVVTIHYLKKFKYQRIKAIFFAP